MSNIIESAIIGCGNWGKNHARVYHELEKSSLNTVCDIDINKASYIAMRYGANFCIDSNIVFKSSIINAVSICTPTITHFQLAKQALESGKHVLVEKPMTHCVEKAIEL